MVSFTLSSAVSIRDIAGFLCPRGAFSIPHSYNTSTSSTGRRTDERTWHGNTALCVASRGKSCVHSRYRSNLQRRLAVSSQSQLAYNVRRPLVYCRPTNIRIDTAAGEMRFMRLRTRDNSYDEATFNIAKASVQHRACRFRPCTRCYGRK